MTEPDQDLPGLPLALEQSVLIAASAQTVWSLWTRPEGLQQWWGAAEVDATPGGIIRVAIGTDTLQANRSPTGPVMRGRFVELDPPRRLVFSFGWETDPPSGPMPPESTTVEVTLTPHQHGTLLRLRHTELPPHQTADHITGWTHYLGTLTDTALTDTATIRTGRREPT